MRKEGTREAGQRSVLFEPVLVFRPLGCERAILAKRAVLTIRDPGARVRGAAAGSASQRECRTSPW